MIGSLLPPATRPHDHDWISEFTNMQPFYDSEAFRIGWEHIGEAAFV